MDYEEQNRLRHLAEAALAPMKQWHHRCHEASIALVQSKAIPGLRVARGTAKGVGSQHSWVTIGDPYQSDVMIFDPTLWSYTGIAPEVYVGGRNKWRHRPHGFGSIFAWGRPPEVSAKHAYKLKPPKGGWSDAAQVFFETLGPIDLEGWRILAHAPVQGWPAQEILTAMCKHSEELRMAIPIDIRCMVCGEVNELYPRS